MRLIKSHIVLSLFLAFISTGCEPEILEAFPDEPAIELISISSDKIVQFKDQLVIRLNYKDGNGDLGSYDPDVKTVWVKDDRLAEPDWYFLAPLGPPDQEVAIQGTIDIKLNGTFLLGTSDEESTFYNIKILDRSGNWSNTILTPSITIVKE